MSVGAPFVSSSTSPRRQFAFPSLRVAAPTSFDEFIERVKPFSSDRKRQLLTSSSASSPTHLLISPHIAAPRSGLSLLRPAPPPLRTTKEKFDLGPATANIFDLLVAGSKPVVAAGGMGGGGEDDWEDGRSRESGYSSTISLSDSPHSTSSELRRQDDENDDDIVLVEEAKWGQTGGKEEGKGKTSSVEGMPKLEEEPKYPKAYLTDVTCTWGSCGALLKGPDERLDHILESHVNTLEPTVKKRKSGGGHTRQSSRGEPETTESAAAAEFGCQMAGCATAGGKRRGSLEDRFRWLKNHILQRHAGRARAFRCMMDGCSERFTSLAALSKHISSGHEGAVDGPSTAAAPPNGDAGPNRGAPGAIRRRGRGSNGAGTFFPVNRSFVVGRGVRNYDAFDERSCQLLREALQSLRSEETLGDDGEGKLRVPRTARRCSRENANAKGNRQGADSLAVGSLSIQSNGMRVFAALSAPTQSRLKQHNGLWKWAR